MKVFIGKIENYELEAISSFLLSLPFWSELEGKKTILIKPNLLGAFSPEKAVTTHPVILEALIKLLLQKGKEIWLGDSHGGTTPLKQVWRVTGMSSLADKYPIRLINFSEGGVQECQSNGFVFNVAKPFWEADFVINIGKYKTHSLMNFTGAVKNLYGLIPGLKKSDYHRDYPTNRDFSYLLTALYDAVRLKDSFHLIDGILGMEGEGPSAGLPRNFGVLFAGKSAAAVDYIASRMMGFRPENVDYIVKALSKDGLKQYSIEIDSEWKDFVFADVKIKNVKMFVKFLAHSPGFFKKFFQKIFRVYPDFKTGCRLCGICVDSCPMKAMRIEKNALSPRINYSKCINCMCCHELCPYSVVYVKKSFLAKLIVK